MYYPAHVAVRLRNVGTFNWRRVTASAVLLALIPAAHEVEALVALAMVAAVCATLTSYETLRHRDRRAEIRHPTEAHA